ncbi:MAG: DNA replication/repair protein RecF [Deltaproteobacteria bacterium]|nr:DNA replication/repair protein RecF [Deltaproteobacteria bacterium]
MAEAALRFMRLYARGFRNLERLDLEPGPRFNVLSGDNGAGKSNLLEALYLLGVGRSFRGAAKADMVRLDEDEATLEALLDSGTAPRRLGLRLPRRGSRRLLLDGKRPRSLAVWHAAVQVVLFHPGHLALSTGGSELRRAFLDRMLEQMSPSYASNLSCYTRALKSRNRLLKDETPDGRALLAYAEILAREGAELVRERATLVEELHPKAERAFEEISGAATKLELRYLPRVEGGEEQLREAIAASLSEDLRRGYTTQGPHLDDVTFTVSQVSARHYASQGQHRALVLSLKVAELDTLTKRVGRTPILLLDDVSSELDRSKSRRLFSLLARLGGQIFLTTTHPEFILLDEHRVDFEVKEGRVTPAR